MVDGIGEGVEFLFIEDVVMKLLEDVIDFELGIDMVNFGLIYDIYVDDDGNCVVIMMLIIMGCLLGNLLVDQINWVVISVDGVIGCEIDLVWELVWDMSKMSCFVKVVFGIYG